MVKVPPTAPIIDLARPYPYDGELVLTWDPPADSWGLRRHRVRRGAVGPGHLR